MTEKAGKIQKKALFMILVTFLAVGACSCSKRSSGSGIVQTRMGTGTNREEAKEQVQHIQDDTQEEEAVESGLYIVTKIEQEAKQASFQKVTSKRQTQYAYDTGTQFLDKYDNTKSIASFLPGDVVELDVLGSERKLLRVKMSDEVWVYEDIVNYSIEEEKNAMVIGQTKYSYDSDMEIFSGEATIGFSGLGNSDVLRAVGIGKKLISLSVAKGHGYLALANTKLFEGSFICVGDRIFEEVTKNMQMEIPEGKYLVTVANNGYGGSREITVERDKTTSLNLDELKGEGPKICKVVFDVGVEGALLFIDGKKADYSAPVELSYGMHSIVVEAEGFDAITQKLVVNSPSAEIEIALSEASGSGEDKADEDAKKDTANNEKNNNANQNNQNNGNNNNNNGNNNNNNNNGNNSNGNNGNNNSNNGNNNGNNANGNASQSDYLTTLYNLLQSMNNSGSSSGGNSNTGNNSNAGDSYDDLRDQ